MTQMSGEEAQNILEDAQQKSDDACNTGICARVHTDNTGKIQLFTRKHRLLTDGMAAMLAVSLWGCSPDDGGSETEVWIGEMHEIPAATIDNNQQPELGRVTVHTVEPKHMVKGIVAPPREPEQPEPIELMGDVMVEPQPVKVVGAIKHIAQAQPKPAVVECQAMMGEMIITEPIKIPKAALGKVVLRPAAPAQNN
ncbi:MAG: hypothetical protein HRU15_11555 [Planctomycetes bacterium]|nr:hypothetical protein [Planctomycetota bacterium]